MTAPQEPFTWGEGGAVPLSEKRKRVADALMRGQGIGEIDTSPIGHWTQGLARIAGSAADGYRRRQEADAFLRSQYTGTGLNRFPGAPLPPSPLQQIGAAFKGMFK